MVGVEQRQCTECKREFEAIGYTGVTQKCADCSGEFTIVVDPEVTLTVNTGLHIQESIIDKNCPECLEDWSIIESKSDQKYCSYECLDSSMKVKMSIPSSNMRDNPTVYNLCSGCGKRYAIEGNLITTHCSAECMFDRHVDSPSHYNHGNIEVIDAIEDWELDFALGNVVKYVSRAGKKDPEKELEDLKKAQWYLERKIKELE